jgi:P27 family predicted phage terminase small subunit
VRGRKRKPAQQKIREGNAGNRPTRELVIAPGTLAPPPDLPDEAVEMWGWLVSRLDAARILDQVDLPALVAMCVQWARGQQAQRVLDEEGMFELGSMGQLVEHPAISIERQAHTLFLRFAEQYGLTAAARARIAATVRVPAQSKLQEIIEQEPDELEPAAEV